MMITLERTGEVACELSLFKVSYLKKLKSNMQNICGKQFKPLLKIVGKSQWDKFHS